MQSAAVLALALAAAPQAAAQAWQDALPPLGRMGAAHAEDGATLVLADGRVLRLAGIDTPLGEVGRARLEELSAGRELQLLADGPAGDRHGRLVAQAFTPEGTWLQGLLLEEGLARVAVWEGDAAALAFMLAVEAIARREGRGLWAQPAHSVKGAGALAPWIGSFQVVEGRVVDVGEVRGRIYLNFGDDWRSDFTVTVAPGERAAFAAAGLDLMALRGRRVRTRGWVDSYNGPMIEARHPAQIEVME